MRLSWKRDQESMLPPLDASHSHRALLMAFLSTACLYMIHRWLLPPLNEQAASFGYSFDAIRHKLFESGPIPEAILGLFFFGGFYLWLLSNSRTRTMDTRTRQDEEVLSAAVKGDMPRLGRALQDGWKEKSLGFYGDRIGRLFAQWLRDPDHAVVHAFKDDIVSNDEDALVHSFVAVQTAEWGLPILGFLGTVVGLGWAIRDIARAVQGAIQRGAPDAAMLNGIMTGFDGLALAFDTTFLGLLALFIIGGGHMLERKRFARRLARYRDQVTEVVGAWPYSREVEEREMRNQLREFREIFLKVAEEDPSMDHVYAALTYGTVGFEKASAKFVDRIVKLLTAQLGKSYEFSDLTAGSKPEETLVGGIRSGRGGAGACVLVATMGKDPELQKLPYEPDMVAISDDCGLMAVSAADSSAIRGYRPQFNGGALVLGESQDVHLRLGQGDKMKSAGDGRSGAVLFLSTGGTMPALYCIESQSGRVVSNLIASLDPNVEWKDLTVTPRTGVALVSGQYRGGGMVCTRIGLAPDASPDAGSGLIHVPPEYRVRDVYLLSLDELLLVTTSGGLLHWSLDRRPIPVSHERWRAHPDVRIEAGPDRQFAAHSSGTLTMWRLTRGGSLRKTGESYDLSNLDARGLVACPNGKFLYAAAGGSVFAWRFPDLKLRGDEREKRR